MENLTVTPGESLARVIMNARTGSVVMNKSVMVEACAVAHGNLTVTISSEPQVSQPAPLSKGETVVTQQAQIEITSEKAGLVMLPRSTSLNGVVKALNAVGATPQDLLAILQAMKAAGALRAELEII
jgi:flagellar P-ring protein precursor FlgI